MAIVYFAAILNGLAYVCYNDSIHELACIAYFLISRIAERPKNVTRPLFLVAMITFVVMVISFIIANVVLAFNSSYFDRLAAGVSPVELNNWFATNAALSSYVSLVVSLLLVVVIFMRTRAILVQDKSKLFRFYTFGISLVIFAGGIAAAYYIPTCFSAGYDYDKTPNYPLYILCHGFLVNTLLSFHMTFSAFVFLYTIYSSRGIPIAEFLFDWLIQQNGARYFIMLGFNGFNIVCFFYAMIFGQNAVMNTN
jgi:MFS family permease